MEIRNVIDVVVNEEHTQATITYDNKTSKDFDVHSLRHEVFRLLDENKDAFEVKRVLLLLEMQNGNIQVYLKYGVIMFQNMVMVFTVTKPVVVSLYFHCQQNIIGKTSQILN